jgi:quinol monooxygenase YgiN
VFALWEVYRDEIALKAHMEAEHFRRLALNGIRQLATDRQLATVFPLE